MSTDFGISAEGAEKKMNNGNTTVRIRVMICPVAPMKNINFLFVLPKVNNSLKRFSEKFKY
jgi:hypothetical protein